MDIYHAIPHIHIGNQITYGFRIFNTVLSNYEYYIEDFWGDL